MAEVKTKKFYGILVGKHVVETMNCSSYFVPERIYENFFSTKKKLAESLVEDHNKSLEADESNAYVSCICDYWQVKELTLFY